MSGTKARPAPSASRFTARVRRRRIVRTLLVLAVLGLGGAGVWLVAYSDVLTVTAVRVAGADGELADTVRETADVPMGEQLVHVDTGAITDRVRDIRELADASVSRSWPTSLTISVSPRVPMATVADDGSWWRIDADGVLFGPTSGRPAELSEIDVPVGADARNARAAGVAVVTSLPDSLAEQVSAVTVESAADVRLELADGPTVMWGTAERGDDKTAVLLALIDEYGESQDDEESPDRPGVYDVSAPDRPAVTP